MPMRRRTSGVGTRGFSLVELTVVLVVLGVVLAIATPRFSDAASHRRADLALDRIERDIRLAEQDAWHTGRSRELVFDVANNRYEIVGMTDGSGNPYIVDLSKAPYYLSVTSVDFGGETKAVLDGRGEALAQGTIVLADGAISVTASVESSDSDTLSMDLSATIRDLLR
ncbi:MAG: prepilin-type N-terminal cleavage/methylation domain-containing protein [Phycisphaerales bacterium JB041]